MVIAEKSKYEKKRERQREYQKNYREKNKDEINKKNREKYKKPRIGDYGLAAYNKEKYARGIWDERKELMLKGLEDGTYTYVRSNNGPSQGPSCIPVEVEFLKYDGKFVYLKSVRGKYIMTFTIQQLWDYLIRKEVNKNEA